MVESRKLLRVAIMFQVTNPSGGVIFVSPEGDGTLFERAVHLYTLKDSGSWFPGVWAWNDPCTWKLEIKVDQQLTAICSGDLLDTYATTEDGRQKTFHYHLTTPTPARNVGLVIGAFEILVHPDMHEVTHFCLPELMPMLKTTTETFDKVFEFFEELLSMRYPYASYKQVFLDIPTEMTAAFASLAILSVNLLYSRRIIDQVPLTRVEIAKLIASQFFGAYVSPASWTDSWLTGGIAAHITELYVQKQFGNNEYLFRVNQNIKRVLEHESNSGPIALSPKAPSSTGVTASAPADSQADQKPPQDQKDDNWSPFSFSRSSHFARVRGQKAQLVIRLMERKLGRDLMCQVLNQLMSVVHSAAEQKTAPVTWMSAQLSAESFLRCVSSVTGQDLTEFFKLWAYTGGHAHFTSNFDFNKKRNILEVEISQNLNLPGSLKYLGPLVMAVQEVDGQFRHTLQIDDQVSKHEVNCHSKARRQKRKKIPLSTGEEVDMDVGMLEQECPILWVRIDPDMNTLSKCVVKQPDYQWQYQLKYERDIVAQLEALESLKEFPTTAARFSIVETIENEHCFHRVREAACFTNAEVANRLASSWTGLPALVPTFKKLFSSLSSEDIVRENDFTNFHHYFLQKAMVRAMGRLRSTTGDSIPEVRTLLLDLMRFNYNARNKYADDYYRAALIEALASTVVAEAHVMYSSSASMTHRTKVEDVAEEVITALNIDKMPPSTSYKYVVTCSCLEALCQLQLNRRITVDPSLFMGYLDQSLFWEVRWTAADCLAKYIRHERDIDTFLVLIETAASINTEPFLRWTIIEALLRHPPFSPRRNSRMNSRTVGDPIWNVMISTSDSQLQALLADLYLVLFGRNVPGTEVQEVPEKKEEPTVVTVVKDEKDATATEPDSNSVSSKPMPATVPIRPVSPSALSASSSSDEEGQLVSPKRPKQESPSMDTS